MQNVMWKNGQKVTPKARKNQFWEPFWLPKTFVFFRDFGYKNEDGFLLRKNKQKWRKTVANLPPKSPPEVKLNGPWGLAFGRWLRR